MVIAIFPISAQELSNAVDQCNRLFGENNATCIEFVDEANLINGKDTRMNNLHNRLLTLISQVSENGDNPGWLLNNEHTIAVADAEYTTLMLDLNRFINNYVIPLEDELITLNTENNTDWDALNDLTETYKGDFRLDWDAVGSDLALLQADFNAAKTRAGIVSPDEQTEASNDAGAEEPEESEIEEFIPDPLDVVAIAEEACASLLDTGEYNRCLFQEAWVTMEAGIYCSGIDDDLCEIIRDIKREERIEADDWERLFELYSADDDPLASIAVAKCHLFPSFDENGNEVSLDVCAEIEYITLTVPEAEEQDETSSTGAVIILEEGHWFQIDEEECYGRGTIVQDFVAGTLTVTDHRGDFLYILTGDNTYIHERTRPFPSGDDPDRVQHITDILTILSPHEIDYDEVHHLLGPAGGTVIGRDELWSIDC